MNPDIQRTFLIKLLVMGIAMGAISHFFVEPKSTQAADFELQLKGQTAAIELGERNIEEHAERVRLSIEEMRTARDSMLDDLLIDESVQWHQLLQRAAVANGLTVTRVEPLQPNYDEILTGSPEQTAKIERKQFRLECNGLFSGLVAYIHELQSGPYRAQVENFRIVPESEQSVRVVLNVSLIALVEYPAQIRSELAEPSREQDELTTQEDQP